MMVTFDIPKQYGDLLTFTLIGGTDTDTLNVRTGSLNISEGTRHVIIAPDGEAYKCNDQDYLKFRREMDEKNKKK